MSLPFGLSPDSPLLKSDFVFGTATSAFQIEGATQKGGRVPSIWDTFCATQGKVRDNDTGETACDHYHRWQDDIQLIKELGFDAYRFSIAWPRIITDEKGTVNNEGLAFYEDIICALEDVGIKPYVTLYHWDLPQFLQDQGGWQNRETCQAFVPYADVVSQHFGDHIHSYTTFNEPWVIAMLGYYLGIHAPGIRDRKTAYQVSHHLLLAHGLALPTLRKNAPNATHGIVLNGGPVDPFTESEEDIEAAAFCYDELVSLYADPLFLGHYPPRLMQRFPDFFDCVQPGDLETIHQAIDFLGFNYYTRGHAMAGNDGTYAHPSMNFDKQTQMGWEIYPEGLYRILAELDQRYAKASAPLPTLVVTENGMAWDDKVEAGKANDAERVEYFSDHLKMVEKAKQHGIDVSGYFAWSLMDNFEWAEGYSKRFGLIHVDYETQKRTTKLTGEEFKKLMFSIRKAGSTD